MTAIATSSLKESCDKWIPQATNPGGSTGNLHGLIAHHARLNKLGDVLASETGFVVARTAYSRATVIARDIAFVSRGRIPTGTNTFKFLELAPDLVVETLSPSDKAADIDEKIALWLRAGVKLALVLDPASRSITTHRSNSEVADCCHRVRSRQCYPRISM